MMQLGMTTRCGNCGNPGAIVQANDITDALNRAKDKKLRGYCGSCDWNGLIAEEEQAKIVASLIVTSLSDQKPV
jgi:hypothetical protein